MERFFDIFLSSIAIFILSPLLFFVILILKLSGEGEIFFLQERIGKGNKTFKLYKFATMLKNSPNIGTGTITIKDDPRVLPIGKILRKTKINELPQLLNILFGEMSIVGPRPLTAETFSAYSQEIQEAVSLVKPGLSGIGSIIFRDEENIISDASVSSSYYKNIISPYKGVLEKWFVLNKGKYVYFMTIFITMWVIFLPNSKIAWKVFGNLPSPPDELKKVLNYSK
ncbi:MAG: lipid carrier--UDP-N-acetylgalactosaminyltransferase [Legionellales bacterium]|nr:lipid carrier--UDP-N-acetylgalactosaminyltransferase [Legionellales bacterium]|tara:strand:+ start:2360 stop:3037 length:678 start_codon:yes stop_codon:yes gene_type:complete